MEIKTVTRVTITLTESEAKKLAIFCEFAELRAHETEEEAYNQKAIDFARDLADRLDDEIN